MKLEARAVEQPQLEIKPDIHDFLPLQVPDKQIVRSKVRFKLMEDISCIVVDEGSIKTILEYIVEGFGVWVEVEPRIAKYLYFGGMSFIDIAIL